MRMKIFLFEARRFGIMSKEPMRGLHGSIMVWVAWSMLPHHCEFTLCQET